MTNGLAQHITAEESTSIQWVNNPSKAIFCCRSLLSFFLIQNVSVFPLCYVPGSVAQSVGHLTRKSGSWVRYQVWQHTFVSPSAFSRRAVVSYWRKYVHEVLVNRLGGLRVGRKNLRN